MTLRAFPFKKRVGVLLSETDLLRALGEPADLCREPLHNPHPHWLTQGLDILKALDYKYSP